MPDPLDQSDSSAGLPSDDQVRELLAPEFSRSGVEIESVVVSDGGVEGRPSRIAVVVDSDTPVDLDAVAGLSRTASALLDEADTGWQAYELEITTPGVDRPLTTVAHFRRAHLRLAQIRLTNGEDLLGRIGITHDDGVQVVLRKPIKGPDGPCVISRSRISRAPSCRWSSPRPTRRNSIWLGQPKLEVAHEYRSRSGKPDGCR